MISAAVAGEELRLPPISEVTELEAERVATEWIDDQVSLLWYPKAGYSTIGHIDLAVVRQTWDANRGFKVKSTVQTTERTARTSDRGFFRYRIRVTRKELADLERYLSDRENLRLLQNCVVGSCRALTSATGIKIPWFFTRSPVLVSTYLTLVGKLGYVRVVGVEYVGKNRLRNLLTTTIPSELAATSFISGAVGVVVWYVVDYLGHFVQMILPIH